MQLAGLWDQLVDAVCRPPRDDYTEADLVGGRRASFRLYSRKYYRQDVQLENSRGQKLQCSHYRPCVTTSADGRLPCVVYLHCNSGSRRDAEEIMYSLLPKGITVFALDFAGSGLSEGGYVTLGAHETDDLAAVVQYLREEGSTSTIGLWGRSMGAVTALLYSQRDPSVAGMVLDSPFSRLVDLMLELATDQQLRIPKPLLKMALAMLKRSVRKRAGFSVDNVSPLDRAGESYIPALFGHARDDTFVNKHHSERLYQAYAGDKNFVAFDGDHNSVRPAFFYDSALIFLLQALRCEEQLVGADGDLGALPEEALPHLHPRGRSIYVTASRHLSSQLDEGEAGDAGSGAGSGASTPGRPSSPSGGRVLRPPWALQGARRVHVGVDAAGVPGEQPLRLHLTSLEQLGEGGGQLAALGGSPLAEELGALHISEEEALQRALELSLQDARQQQGAAEAGGAPAAGGDGDGAPPEQQPQAATAAAAAGAPLQHAARTEDEEAQMLAAAIAASLRDEAGQAAAAAGNGPGVGQAAAAPVGGEQEEEEQQQQQQQQQRQQGEAEQDVPAEKAVGWGAAQLVADAHSGAEAAAVRAASVDLQHAMHDAAQQDDWEP